MMEREELIDFLINKGNGVTGLSQLKPENIPDQFILPTRERLHHIQVSTQETIPIIDVSKWDDPVVSESICGAAAKWGFFQIINHGIPIDVLEDAKRAAHGFFELPLEERRKYLEENSPTPAVMLRTSFSPFADQVLEWKDALVLLAGKQNEGSRFWHPVYRSNLPTHHLLVLLYKLNCKLLNYHNFHIYSSIFYFRYFFYGNMMLLYFKNIKYALKC